MRMKTIEISEEVYDRIIKDKIHFENTIGGKKWSTTDVITEYLKIINAKSD